MELNASLYALKQEIFADPSGRGYADMTAAQIAADLNDPRYVATVERMISERTLFAIFGPDAATQMLDAMETMSLRKMKRVYQMLTDVASGGVDVSVAESGGLLGALVAGGVLTAEQSATIKALAERRTSRAQQIGYNELTAQMVERVLEVM